MGLIAFSFYFFEILLNSFDHSICCRFGPSLFVSIKYFSFFISRFCIHTHKWFVSLRTTFVSAVRTSASATWCLDVTISNVIIYFLVSTLWLLNGSEFLIYIIFSIFYQWCSQRIIFPSYVLLCSVTYLQYYSIQKCTNGNILKIYLFLLFMLFILFLDEDKESGCRSIFNLVRCITEEIPDLVINNNHKTCNI